MRPPPRPPSGPPCPARGLAAAGVLLLLAGLLAPVAARAGEEPAERERVAAAVAPLATWLDRPDPVLRALAAFELRRLSEEGAVLVATRALAAEEDPLVRTLLLRSLQRARADLVAEGGTVLPGLLLRAARDETRVVREAAVAVLARLEAPPEPDAAQRWWLEGRRALEEEQARLLEARAAARAAAHAAREGGESDTTPRPEGDLLEDLERLRQDGLDLVIVMDHTGSMAPVIAQARARAASLVARLAWVIPRFRAGLVTYDDGPRLRMALTTDGEVLAKAFRKVGAGGGADWEEGVDKGVRLALEQDQLGWSRRARRVIVVIGDAPPHEHDVEGLLAMVARAREDVLYDHAVVVHAVSTTPMGVPHFGALARAGGGRHVTLADAGRLEAELVALAFGEAWRDRVASWLDEVEALRRALRR